MIGNEVAARPWGDLAKPDTNGHRRHGGFSGYRSFDEIFSDYPDDYPDLEHDDVKQALEYAAASTYLHLCRLRKSA